jgi:hypothetical protein
MRIASLGHAVFAATLVALGILGLIQADFTPTLSGVPKDFPARELLIYLCALVSLGTGIGLLWQRTAIVASRVLLAFLLLWLLLFRASHLFFTPTEVGTWWACCDTAVMTAAAWVLYAWFVGDRDGPLQVRHRRQRTAHASALGLALIPLALRTSFISKTPFR